MIKGVEVKDGNIRIFADVIEEILGCRCSALSGANIANEGMSRRKSVGTQSMYLSADSSLDVASSVAQDKFSETTIGYREGDIESAEIFHKVFDRPTFKVGLVEDVAGVSLCGALKNVVAIAAGFTDGLGWGDNAKGELLV
jgi:glycerol-3-phosphate dehydrogenase (NAD+)